jgi:hypothetical protein
MLNLHERMNQSKKNSSNIPISLIIFPSLQWPTNFSGFGALLVLAKRKIDLLN